MVQIGHVLKRTVVIISKVCTVLQQYSYVQSCSFRICGFLLECPSNHWLSSVSGVQAKCYKTTLATLDSLYTSFL